MALIALRLIAVALLVAGVAKVIAPESAMLALQGAVPRPAIAHLVGIAAAADVMIGSWTLLRPREAAWPVLGLMGVYSAYLAWMGHRTGWTSGCGCGLGEVSVLVGLLRNALFAGVAAVVLRRGSAAG